MTRGIGWYVHHQGAGHLQRARAVATALPRPCTIIGTLAGFDTAGLDILDLPDDRPLGDAAFDGRDGATERPEALHYAPLNHPGLRARMARIAEWVARTDPALLVVDVSVEVALFARLLSVPTLVVRLAGTRTDQPHCEAFRSASRVLAPFPEALDGAGVPEWVRAKTVYAGFLTGPALTATEASHDIVVVFGQGGAGGDRPALAAAARAVPDRTWHVLGPVSGSGAIPDNLHLHGWVPDVAAYVARAALLVGGGGDGVVALAAAQAKRFLCLPEPRAYGEQTEKAAALARLGAAIVHVGWPEASAWPGLIQAGLALDPAVIGGLHSPTAVIDCAAAIDALAGSFEQK
ncbi:Predicted glycosyl transferase [Methylobacterium phyllostachyos]|uniref:Predicted glycosyl transferase n=1 Tax=Methylobacterium phyllostachyos TaxID=582672 RepID=A0A1G9RCB1_9HYPH|nr:glycosyltransferase [Methylobacterium phyllostachyos]SDM20896.1 Predicted glycosyl transferase [Methylobacterium phyllostachyos]